MKQIKVGLAQISIKNGDKSHNLQVIRRILDEARKKEANLLIFPELALTGYVCRDFFYELAETINGPSVKLVCQFTRENGLTTIFGMPLEEDVKGVIYNSSVMIDEDGDVVSYNKLYLPTHSVFDEKRYFRSGNETKCFQTKKCKIGLTICYDIYFPEIYRILALEGAELVTCISASPSTRQEYFETLTKARAIENGVFLAFVNRVGIEDGLQFWGGSNVVSPNGDIVAKARYYEEDLTFVTLDLEDLRRVRPFVPTIKDLRTEILDRLVLRAHEI
jgi:predicted amidohydrolase